MSEFFKGWKRRVGCVTLVMACSFAATWSSSEYISDVVEVCVATRQFTIKSFRGKIFWHATNEYYNPRNKWSSRTVTDPKMIAGYLAELKMFTEFLSVPPSDDQRLGVVSYLNVVAPLAALAALLLLTKPRPTTTIKTSGPKLIETP